jgi:hypothetical protein
MRGIMTLVVHLAHQNLVAHLAHQSLAVIYLADLPNQLIAIQLE